MLTRMQRNWTFQMLLVVTKNGAAVLEKFGGS